MIAYDSSVWIERWRRDAVGEEVDGRVRDLGGDPMRIVVPAPVVFETYRWLMRHVDDERAVAERAMAIERHDVVPVDAWLARRAAITGIATGLAAADATILAATRARHATLLTYDSDFIGIPDVVVLER